MLNFAVVKKGSENSSQEVDSVKPSAGKKPQGKGWVKTTYRVTRLVLVVALVLAVALPASVYVAIGLPSVQRWLCTMTQSVLTRTLGVPVTIGEMNISGFNQVALRDVTVLDYKADTIAHARRLGAGVDLYALLWNKRVVVTHAFLQDFDGRLWRDTIGSPLNIQPIIDRLSPKEKREQQPFELEIHNVMIRHSRLSYDVLRMPCLEDRFDVNHIEINDLRADVLLPLLKNDDFTVDVRRLAFEERAGFHLNELAVWVHFTKKALTIKNLSIDLPASHFQLADTEVKYRDLDSLKTTWMTVPLDIQIDKSYFTPSDFASFLPALSQFNSRLDMVADIRGPVNNLHADRLLIGSPDQVAYIDIAGSAQGLPDIDKLTFDLPQFTLKAAGIDAIIIGEAFTEMPPAVKRNLLTLGVVDLDVIASGTPRFIEGQISVQGDPGAVEVEAVYEARDKWKTVTATVTTDGIALGDLLNTSQLGLVAGQVQGTATFNGRLRSAQVEANIEQVEYRGHNYNLWGHGTYDNDDVTLSCSVENTNAAFSIDAEGNIGKKDRWLRADAFIHGFDPEALGLWNKYPGYNLTAEVHANLRGHDIDDADGTLVVSHLAFASTDASKPSLEMERLDVELDASTLPRNIDVTCDYFDLAVRGDYHFATLWPQIQEIAAHSFPVVLDTDHPTHTALDQGSIRAANSEDSTDNDFTFSARIKDIEPLYKFFNLPINVLASADIEGAIDYPQKRLMTSLDAPYLAQKDKLIESTFFNVNIDGDKDQASLFFTTSWPTKEGYMPLILQCSGGDNRVDTRMSWKIDRERDYSGDLSLSILLGRNEANQLTAKVDIQPGRMTFNDSVWTVHLSTILYEPKRLEVEDFNVSRSGQWVKINGLATPEPDDCLTVELQDVNLDYIFESLGLTNVMLGGDATGSIMARGAFSSAPQLLTDNLTVKNISYNRTVLGNADVRSYWDNDQKAVSIDADLHQPNEAQSRIYGKIFATRDSLEMNFDCNEVDVGFMKPFVQAFCSDITGYATGHARLWGTFKDLDVEGAVMGQDVQMKIDIINATYTVSDSVIIRPGRILLNDVTLFDPYGHTAKLNGVITHDYFHDPTFDFRITDAERFLCYDMTEKLSPIWYGRVFGNGSARILGVPGRIDISCDMTTARNSTFTFVLSDQLEAAEYSFITFRDRSAIAARDSLERLDTTPEAVKLFKAKLKQQEEESASAYYMDFNINVTPDAKIIIVMDPEGGDQVVAYGNGHIYMGYDSKDEDLVMRGMFTLDHGTYNFTLQDIILKDFTIQQGSSINFQGDPYNAVLNLEAIYTTNANLTDLDESFAQDKEVNRTNVPVNAVLKVSGFMRQPDLSFDLAFPTLTNDTYTKVKSIINTEEMMSRQILYLLALNRFYTPEYMTTTKGNELVSVASSTLSSQLSNMLGQLSDNWSIATNVRSDRGDFSDVEVDVALSSQLLNNRLLFNGNLGYRDKSLNTNQFIGDFDIQYLLNRSGNIRLKAYNRYNDQNFYIKTATTTQGVGIMFRRDFDNMFSFLRRRKKNSTDTVTISPDSTSNIIEVVSTMEVDSIATNK